MGSLGTSTDSPNVIPTVDISPFIASLQATNSTTLTSTYLSNDSQTNTNGNNINKPNSVTAAALTDVVEQVRHACTVYGFFYLVGHGITLEEQNKALDCAKLFFTIPMEERLEIQIKNSMGKSHRGYEPAGIQVHQEGLKPDTKEVSLDTQILSD